MHLKKQSFRGWFGFSLSSLCFILLAGCGSSSSGPDPNNSGRLAPGRYRYVKFTNLARSTNPSCVFSNGGKTSTEEGYTTVAETSDGFSFFAGENGRWELKGTYSADNEELADVNIYLTNKCLGEVTYLSHAWSEGFWRDSSREEWRITQYVIDWTCGGEVQCIAEESWLLERDE